MPQLQPEGSPGLGRAHWGGRWRCTPRPAARPAPPPSWGTRCTAPSARPAASPAAALPDAAGSSRRCSATGGPRTTAGPCPRPPRRHSPGPRSRPRSRPRRACIPLAAFGSTSSGPPMPVLAWKAPARGSSTTGPGRWGWPASPSRGDRRGRPGTQRLTGPVLLRLAPAGCASRSAPSLPAAGARPGSGRSGCAAYRPRSSRPCS